MKEISQNLYETYDQTNPKKKFKLSPKTNTSMQILKSIEEIRTTGGVRVSTM